MNIPLLAYLFCMFPFLFVFVLCIKRPSILQVISWFLPVTPDPAFPFSLLDCLSDQRPITRVPTHYTFAFSLLDRLPDQRLISRIPIYHPVKTSLFCLLSCIFTFSPVAHPTVTQRSCGVRASKGQLLRQPEGEQHNTRQVVVRLRLICGSLKSFLSLYLFSLCLPASSYLSLILYLCCKHTACTVVAPCIVTPSRYPWKAPLSSLIWPFVFFSS